MAIDGSYGASTVPHNLVVDGKWHHYALTFEPKPDSATNSYVQCFCDYEAISKRTFNRPKKRVAGHRLILGEGFNDNPNIQMEFDALRISKGVLDPSQFPWPSEERIPAPRPLRVTKNLWGQQLFPFCYTMRGWNL